MKPTDVFAALLFRYLRRAQQGLAAEPDRSADADRTDLLVHQLRVRM
jgi:hypothetical protein